MIQVTEHADTESSPSAHSLSCPFIFNTNNNNKKIDHNNSMVREVHSDREIKIQGWGTSRTHSSAGSLEGRCE